METGPGLCSEIIYHSNLMFTPYRAAVKRGPISSQPKVCLSLSVLESPNHAERVLWIHILSLGGSGLRLMLHPLS